MGGIVGLTIRFDKDRTYRGSCWTTWTKFRERFEPERTPWMDKAWIDMTGWDRVAAHAASDRQGQPAAHRRRVRRAARKAEARRFL